MKILVTGAAGFIPSHIVELFVSKGHEVIGVDNFLTGSRENVKKIARDFELVEGDVRDQALMTRLCRGIEVVSHQAAASSHAIFLKDLRNSTLINIDGFVNVMECAVRAGVRRVVYASSSSVYGNSPVPLREDSPLDPIYMFSATKVMNEHTAKIFSADKKMETIGLRYMSVYGPREESKAKAKAANLVTQFFWAIEKGEPPVIYGDGTQTRDSVYVKDVATANLLAVESQKKFLGEIANVGTGKMMSLNEIADFLNRFLKKNVKPKHIPTPLSDYIRLQLADTSRAREVLGFEARYDLEKGLKDFMQNR